MAILHLVKDHFQHGGQFVVLDFADARLGAERANIVRRKFLPAQTGRVKPLPTIQGAIENIVIGVRRPGSAIVMPGKLGLRERQAFGKKQDEGWLLFTDEGGWNVSYRGASPLPDETYTNYKESTERGILYILRQRWNEPGISFYSEGRDTFENQPVDIVDITDATGFTVTVSFNQVTKLPVRQTYRRRNPIYKDFDTEVTVYTKYRTVDGIVWPYDIHRERNGDKVFELYADSVQMNKDLKDDLFTLPGKIKILPKGQ